MKVIITKRNGKKVEFEIDENYKFLLEICSFCVDAKGYIKTIGNEKNCEILNLEKGKMHSLHRVLYSYHHQIKLEKEDHIDHIDRDKKNNCINNLRKLTHSENQKNRELGEKQLYYYIFYDKYSNYFFFNMLCVKLEGHF